MTKKQRTNLQPLTTEIHEGTTQGYVFSQMEPAWQTAGTITLGIAGCAVEVIGTELVIHYPHGEPLRTENIVACMLEELSRNLSPEDAHDVTEKTIRTLRRELSIRILAGMCIE
jgi:hypothetical protein